MGWQGKPQSPVSGNVSARLTAEANLRRAVRTFLAHGSTANREALQHALDDLDNL